MKTHLTYSGRRFSPENLDLMRQAAQDYAALGVTEIARTCSAGSRPPRISWNSCATKASCRCRSCVPVENAGPVFPL